MFLGMFKGRNEYGFSLVVFSFASFFMLPGLLSVSNAQSAHEKGQMKSMMAQKVSYRVLAMNPLVVAPETAETQPLEPQAVASQGVELLVVEPNVDGFSAEDEDAPRALESQSVESQAVLPQAVPSDVDADSGDQSFVDSLFARSRTFADLSVFPPIFENQGKNEDDLKEPQVAAARALESRVFEPEIGGTQVEPQGVAFIEPTAVINGDNGVSGLKTVLFIPAKRFASLKGFEPVDSSQGVEPQPVESQAVSPQAVPSDVDADSGAQSIVASFLLSPIFEDDEVAPQVFESQGLESQSVQSRAVLPQAVPSDVDADSGVQSILTPVDSSQEVESEIGEIQVARQPVEPQASGDEAAASQAVESQGVNIQVVLPNVGASFEFRSFSNLFLSSSVSEDEVELQAVPSDVDGAFGTQSFADSFFTPSLADLSISPSIFCEDGGKNEDDLEESQVAGAQAIPLPDVLLQVAGAEAVEPQASAFETPSDVDADSEVQSILTSVDSPQGAAHQPVESRPVSPDVQFSCISRACGDRLIRYRTKFGLQIPKDSRTQFVSQGAAHQPVESRPVSPDVDADSEVQSILTSVDSPQRVKSEISGTQVADQPVAPSVERHIVQFGSNRANGVQSTTYRMQLQFQLQIPKDSRTQVVSQGAAHQLVAPQASAFETPPDVDADSEVQSILTSVDSSQGVEPEIRGTQAARQPVEPQSIKHPIFVSQGFGIYDETEIEPQPVESQAIKHPVSFEPEVTPIEPQALALEASLDVDAASGVIVPQNFEIDGTQVAASLAIPLPDVLPQEPALPAAGAEVFEPQEPAFEASPDVDAAQNAFIGPIIVNVDHNSNNSCCENAPQ